MYRVRAQGTETIASNEVALAIPTDNDADGLPDDLEVSTYQTNPTRWDTDGDGLSDGVEAVTAGLNPLSTNDRNADLDGDGASNLTEMRNGTRLDQSDTDEDGVNDGTEITQLSDLLDASDLGQAPPPGEVANLFLNVCEIASPSTQKYQLSVGAYSVTSNGVICGQGYFDFRRGRKYPIKITRVSSTASPAGSDYDAYISDFREQFILLEDPQRILGRHTNGGPGLNGAPATLLIPKLEIDSPSGDPVANPVPGKNEFTYSSSASGELTLEMRTLVTPTGAAARTASSTRCSFEAVGDSLLQWDSKNPEGKPYVSGDYLIAKAKFVDLPSGNSFGRKIASARLQQGGGSPDSFDSTSYEVFFPKTATNHPGGQASSPNWYFYWGQTGANKTGTTNVVYSNSILVAGKYDFEEDRIYLGDDAATTSLKVWDFPKGIDAYGWVISHEAKHRRQLRGFWPNGRNPLDEGDLPAPDYIPDNVEPTYMSGRPFDPSKLSTYLDTIGYTGNSNAPIPDTEDISMRSQTLQGYPLDPLWSKSSANGQDWANPGKNSKDKFSQPSHRG